MQAETSPVNAPLSCRATSWAPHWAPVSPSQVAAWLMAVCFQGLDDEETAKWLEARCFDPEAARELADLGAIANLVEYPAVPQGGGDGRQRLGSRLREDVGRQSDPPAEQRPAN